MKLLSVDLARVLWFMRASDINPRGLNLWLTFFPALIERYGFSSYPRKEDILDPNKEPGEKFIGGTFRNSQGQDVMLNFTSFDDGFLADTRSSTRDSEAFLVDLSEWAVNEFGLVFRPDMIQRRGYVSTLFVRPEHSFSGLRPELKIIADRLSTLVAIPDTLIEYQPSGFSMNPISSTSIKPSSFIFEPAVDASASENRYFSRAPVHTDIHLELLNELEQLLTL